MKILKILIIFLFVFFIVFLVYFATDPINAPIWTGFYYEDTSGFKYKTLWDWLELLIIPIFLAGCAWFVSSAEKEIISHKELSIERQKILFSFIEKISSLSLTKEFRNPENCPEAINITRSLIMSTMRQLDKDRKSEALQVVYELHFINRNPIIRLHGANFNHINLTSASFSNAEIRGAYFRKASFQKANLKDSIFVGSDFVNADFRGADLRGTDFSYAKLKGANFSGCDLRFTNFEYAKIEKAKTRLARF